MLLVEKTDNKPHVQDVSGTSMSVNIGGSIQREARRSNRDADIPKFQGEPFTTIQGKKKLNISCSRLST